MSEQRWLVCYDIACPRRLARTHRWLSRRAVALQKSVFVAIWDATARREALAALGARIDPREDALTLIPLPASVAFDERGRSWLPGGVIWLGGPLGEALGGP